jgi:hypothetical protein
MFWENLKELEAEEFKQLTGMSPEKFTAMAAVIRQCERRKRRPSRRHKLAVEDRILLTVSYWREYLLSFGCWREGQVRSRLAREWGVHASTVMRTVDHVEHELIRCRQFRLPFSEH